MSHPITDILDDVSRIPLCSTIEQIESVIAAQAEYTAVDHDASTGKDVYDWELNEEQVRVRIPADLWNREFRPCELDVERHFTLRHGEDGPEATAYYTVIDVEACGGEAWAILTLSIELG